MCSGEKPEEYVKLGDIVKNYFADNVLIRLWKNIKIDEFEDECNTQEILKVLDRECVMSWQIEQNPILYNLKFKYIKDIITETNQEAVNIIVELD